MLQECAAGHLEEKGVGSEWSDCCSPPGKQSALQARHHCREWVRGWGSRQGFTVRDCVKKKQWRGRGRLFIYGWFMLMCGRNQQYCTSIILIKNKLIKKRYKTKKQNSEPKVGIKLKWVNDWLNPILMRGRMSSYNQVTVSRGKTTLIKTLPISRGFGIFSIH